MPKGGMRIGAGAKPKPLFDKILEGNPGGRPIKVTNFHKNISDEMPKPSKMVFEGAISEGTKIMWKDSANSMTEMSRLP